MIGQKASDVELQLAEVGTAAGKSGIATQIGLDTTSAASPAQKEVESSKLVGNYIMGLDGRPQEVAWYLVRT